MIRLETTKGCAATPRIAFVLEETGSPWEAIVQPDGHFTATYGVAGPLCHHGDLRLLEPNAILRHLARTRGAGTLWPAEPGVQAAIDRWIDHFTLRIGMSVARGEMPAAMGYLKVLEGQLGGRDWLCGDFSAADIMGASLMQFAARLPLEPLPGVRAWLARVAARPAWARVQARLATLA